MLNLREADVTQTRFYQEVLQIGRQEGVQEGRQEGLQEGRQEGVQIGRQEGLQEGRQEGLQEGRQEGVQIGRQEGLQEGRQEGLREGEAELLIRQLTRRCGNLSDELQAKVRSLSIPQLESLAESLLDFQDISDLDNWLKVVKTI